MSRFQLREVLNILKDEGGVIRDMRQLSDLLNISSAIFEKYSTEYKRDVISPYDFLHGILSNWEKTQGNAATLEILKETLIQIGHRNIADALDSIPSTSGAIPQRSRIDENSHLGKWWPEHKPLVNSHMGRIENGELLVEKLFHDLSKTDSKVKVINQQISISGFGGVGKTTLAKSYANHYQSHYDRIIWLDCGEGNLVTSFNNLAKYLNISTSSRTNISVDCFTELSTHSSLSLLIYDNAECYRGSNGIRDFLPKNHNSLHTIITSRTQEWGHETGFGKIQQYTLSTFSEAESIQFLKSNLAMSVKAKIQELKIIHKLLGGLPLALQIAVAAMNRQNEQGGLTVSNFIERIEKTDLIYSLETLDDYEKSIQKTLNISLENIIANQSYGKLAHNILLSMAYTGPDSNPDVLFAQLEGVCVNDIGNAVDLLVSHSLVSRRSGSSWMRAKGLYAPNINLISVHRLLQKVMRLIINPETEELILKSFLEIENDDFLNYKLLPYQKAKEYPALIRYCQIVESELLQRLRLHELVSRRQFEEAMILSQLLVDTYRNRIEMKKSFLFAFYALFRSGPISKDTYKKFYYASLYNQGLTYYMAGEFTKSVGIFEEVRDAFINKEVSVDLESTTANLSMRKYYHAEKENSFDPLDQLNLFTVDLWLIHLYSLIERHENGHALTKQYSEKRAKYLDIFYPLRSDLIPIELRKIGLVDEDKLELRDIKVQLSENVDDSKFLENLKINELKIFGVTFVDSSGNPLPSVDILNLPYKTTALHAWGCNLSPVRVPKLWVDTINVEFSFIKVNFEIPLDFSPKLTNLTLGDVEVDGGDLNYFVEMCKQLVYLNLHYDKPTRPDIKLRLGSLPTSLKHLELENINICKKDKKINFNKNRNLELDSLSLKRFPIHEVKFICSSIKYKSLEVIGFGDIGKNGISASETGFNENLLDIFHRSAEIKIEDPNLSGVSWLIEYKQEKLNNCYVKG